MCLTVSINHYTHRLERKTAFFWIYYIIPTFIVVIVSNCPFYINKDGVPGRVALPVSLILILLSLLNNITKDIPRLSYNPWIMDYIFGIIMFVTATLVEYAVLSYCYVR